MRANAARVVVVVQAALIGLAGCQGGEEPPKDKVVAVNRSAHIPDWLSNNDSMEAALWLRSREVGHLVLPIDPEVDRLRRALKQASTRFFEDERMIANRTAQTSDMLAQSFERERYVDVMTGLIDVADVSPEKKQYGQLCQHYVNLRKMGVDRTAALNQLMASYRISKGKR